MTSFMNDISYFSIRNAMRIASIIKQIAEQAAKIELDFAIRNSFKRSKKTVTAFIQKEN